MGDSTSRGGTDTTGTGGVYGGNQGGERTGTGTQETDQGMQTGRSAPMGSDANILTQLKTADSSEVAIVQYAMDRLSDTRVKDYAQTLLDDHQKSMNKVKDLAQSENVSLMSTDMSDTSEQHMSRAMSTLSSADKGNAFDAAFLQLTIDDHQANIDKAKSLQSMASNDRIKRHLDDVIPKLQKHLDQAQTLLKDLGMSQTGR